jgi:hypothetical protein
MQQPSLH